MKRAKKMCKSDIVIVNMSGRGDKDVTQVAEIFKLEN
jgi:tryptophan synthase beta subunit